MVGVKKKKRRASRVVSVGCWNMRSLVEEEGSRARKGKKVKGSVEKKSVLLGWELKRYNLFAAGISETKWFGEYVYEVGGYTYLTSGRKLGAVEKCD